MILTNNYVLVKFLGICPSSASQKSWTPRWECLPPSPLSWWWRPLPPGRSTPTCSSPMFGLSADHCLYSGHCGSGSAAGDHHEKVMPPLYKALGIYRPLITTNCTILGVTILNLDNGYNYIESIVCALGAGLGFMLSNGSGSPVCASGWRMHSLPNRLKGCRSPSWRRASCPSPLPALAV